MTNPSREKPLTPQSHLSAGSRREVFFLYVSDMCLLVSMYVNNSNNTSEADVAPCYKWLGWDGIGWSLGGVGCRAPYSD